MLQSGGRFLFEGGRCSAEKALGWCREKAPDPIQMGGWTRSWGVACTAWVRSWDFGFPREDTLWQQAGFPPFPGVGGLTLVIWL